VHIQDEDVVVDFPGQPSGLDRAGGAVDRSTSPMQGREK